MQKFILKIFLVLFTICLIPMIVRKANGKEYDVSTRLIVQHIASFSDNSDHIQNIKDNVETLKTITADGYQFGDALYAIYTLISVIVNVVIVPFDFIVFVFDTFNWYITA